MVKKGARSSSLFGGMRKSMILVKCKKKKKSGDDINYNYNYNYWARKLGKKQQQNKAAEGKLIIKKKKKKTHKVGEMLKTVGFLLKRSSNYMKKKKELKRKKKSLQEGSTDDDDAISSEAKLLLCQLQQLLQEVERDEEEQQLNNIIPVKQGDTINIMPLLFPKHRDYLIKSHTHQLVKAEDLQGKLIVLFFANLCDSIWEQDAFCLIDVYNQIHHKSPFEVVFVPHTCPHDHTKDPQFDPPRAFSRIFSCMPWTAVPYSDSISCQRLQATFGFNGTVYPDSSVIDPTGLVLAVYGNSLFSSFGARGYPYTDQRFNFLIAEERALLQHPSIYNLLTSPEREYVISNDGRQVPILSLEDKVVALHFLEEGHSMHVRMGHSMHVRPDCSYDLTVQLMSTYERLKDKNFEVVLIYIHDSWNTQGRTNEETFWKTFKTMPWLALPFKDPVIKKLMRICSYPLDLEGPAPNPGLVVVGPRGKFFEPYGADILMNFGIQAYPFTRRSMVDLEVEKLKEVKSYMFWDSNTVFIRNDKSEVQFCQVDGKRLIFLIGQCCLPEDAEFLTVLKLEYNRRMGTDEEFEVIQVLDSEVLSDDNEHVADVPWLVQLFDEGSPLLLELLNDAFGDAQLVAFDVHGEVVRKSKYLDIEDMNDPKFPFYAGGLEKEIYSELYTRFDWKYWHKDYIFQI